MSIERPSENDTLTLPLPTRNRTVPLRLKRKFNPPLLRTLRVRPKLGSMTPTCPPRHRSDGRSPPLCPPPTPTNTYPQPRQSPPAHIESTTKALITTRGVSTPDRWTRPLSNTLTQHTPTPTPISPFKAKRKLGFLDQQASGALERDAIAIENKCPLSSFLLPAGTGLFSPLLTLRVRPKLGSMTTRGVSTTPTPERWTRPGGGSRTPQAASVSQAAA
jgi:hypothetical protein